MSFILNVQNVQHFVCSLSAEQELICIFFLLRGLSFLFGTHSLGFTPLGVVGSLCNWLKTVQHQPKRIAAELLPSKKKRKKLLDNAGLRINSLAQPTQRQNPSEAAANSSTGSLDSHSVCLQDSCDTSTGGGITCATNPSSTQATCPNHHRPSEHAPSRPPDPRGNGSGKETQHTHDTHSVVMRTLDLTHLEALETISQHH